MVLVARRHLWYMNSCATNFVVHRGEFVAHGIQFVVCENHVPQIQSHVPQIQSHVPQIRLSCSIIIVILWVLSYLSCFTGVISAANAGQETNNALN